VSPEVLLGDVGQEASEVAAARVILTGGTVFGDVRGAPAYGASG
jgi:hypothetical protein